MIRIRFRIRAVSFIPNRRVIKMARSGMSQKKADELFAFARKAEASAKAARETAKINEDKTVQNILNSAADRFEHDVNYVSKKILGALTKNMGDSLGAVEKFYEANKSVLPVK